MRETAGEEDRAEEGISGAHLGSPMAGPAAGGRAAGIGSTGFAESRAMSRTVAGRRASAYPRVRPREVALWLAGVDVVPQHPVGGIEHGERGTPDHVSIRQVAAEETIGSVVAALNQRGDDDVRIEGTHYLHSNQLEGDRALREAFERANCGLGAQARIARGTRLPLGAPQDRFAGCPLEGDLAGHTARRRAGEREAREPQPFPTESDCFCALFALRALTGHRGHPGVGPKDPRTDGGATSPRACLRAKSQKATNADDQSKRVCYQSRP